MTQFDHEYVKTLFRVYNQGTEELNERTGRKTKILTGCHMDFRVENFPILTLRKIPVKLFVAEQIWYLLGTNDLSFFQQYSRIWDDFKEDDNTVESGYGYRWRNFFARDQIDSLVQMLIKEPSSRQGVVITWDPVTDGLASPKKKNSPCVPVFIANIVNGKLNFHVVFRSNDMMLGMPHDIGGFALLLHIIAQKVNVKPGMLHYSVSHLHVYDNHYPQVEEVLSRHHYHPEVRLHLPENSYDRARAGDATLVDEIIADLESQYRPLPALGKMQIAV